MINALLTFRNSAGRTFGSPKNFSDQTHIDNYINFMMRKGHKFVDIFYADENDAPQ
jgi:hypothetical protein